MKAQLLYDLRQLTGYCSGTDLHEFFRQHVGDPSPSGKVEIPDNLIPDDARQLIRNLGSATKAMREMSVSEKAIQQYEYAFRNGAAADTRLRIAADLDAVS